MVGPSLPSVRWQAPPGPNNSDHIFRTAGGQRGVDVELVLLTHGFQPPKALLAELAHASGVANYEVLAAPPF